MNQTNSTIHTTVMRRVRTIHLLRTAVSGAALSFVILGVSLYSIGREVWVARVFQNMPDKSDVFGVMRFFLSAFESTDVVVQMLILVSVFAVVLLARQAGRVAFVGRMQFA